MISPIFDTDSYKITHHMQYPPGMDYMFDYLESRGGEYKETVFFGLSYIIKEFFSQRITKDQVEAARLIYKQHLGGDYFNYADWMKIVEEYHGFLPVKIRAVKEGSVVPTKNVLMTIESTDQRFPWLVGWLETILMRIWYPITVATLSYELRKVMKQYVEETSDNQSSLDFMLHDFGSRGVSSNESAAIGGLSNLLSFNGTDNIAALIAAKKYYGEHCAGFSIPAAEHSTITSWGRNNERNVYAHIINQFNQAPVIAVVSDSYDYFHAIQELWPSVLGFSGGSSSGDVGDESRKHPGMVQQLIVIRPDSGNPIKIIEESLHKLEASFGVTTNSKGYKVLNKVRLIQGDGVDPFTIQQIMYRTKHYGFASDNVSFGMGGALLQKVNRDTQKFAIKCSAIGVKGETRPVFKDPATDPGKTSKAGVLDLIRRTDGVYATVQRKYGLDSCLETYYHNGMIGNTEDLATIRERLRNV